MNRILKGLQIIQKYEKNGYFAAEHDQIWVGNDDGSTVIQMTEEDAARMEELDWFVDSGLNVWSHFC